MMKKIALVLLCALIFAGCASPAPRVTPLPGDQTPVDPLIDLPTPRLTTIPSTPASRVQTAPRQHADSFAASISNDGRYIVFQSSAGDLIDQDLPACPIAAQATVGQPCQQVYRYDRQTGKTGLVSASANGEAGNGSSGAARLSADGQFIVFSSFADNLGAPSGGGSSPGLFVSDRQAHTITQITADGANPAISGDGRYIVYEGGGNIYLYNRVTGQKDLLSAPDPSVTGDALGPPGSSYTPSISADGDWIAFWSWDGHLVPGDTRLCGDSNCGDVFLYNRIQKLLTRVPMNKPWGVGMKFSPTSLSADGRWLATENILYDTSNGQTTRTQLTGGKISADGYWLLAARGPQVYIQSLDSDKVEQVTLSSQNAPADGALIGSTGCMGPPQCQFETGFDFSADGRYVVFDSTADNLAGPDPTICAPEGVIPHNCADIFLRDRAAGQTIWVTQPVRPAASAAPSLPTVTAQAFTSLERDAAFAASQADGASLATRSEQVYYLQPNFWRVDARSNPPAPREPDILSGDGLDLWHYNPDNNSITIVKAAIDPASHYGAASPPLFGSADKLTSLQDFVNRVTPCYPNPTFLGAGETLAGQPTYVFYLGRSTCAAAASAGPETIWLDQHTLVALRWIVQSTQSALPLSALTAASVKYNPSLTPDWFTKISVPGAVTVDQRK